MRRSLFTKLLSLLLAVVMVVGILPTATLATDEGTEPTGEPEQNTPVVLSDSELGGDVLTEASYTVEHHLQNAEGGYTKDEAATETMTGTVGETTAAVAKTFGGYTAKAIEQKTIAAEGTVVVVYYDAVVEEPQTASYTVEHHLQNAEGGYTKDEEATETMTGTVGETTAAVAKTFGGYTAKAIEQKTIAAEGTVVVVYYDAVVVEPQTASYTVEHYLQNAEGGYTKDEAATETKTGTVGETTAAVAKTFNGYTAKEFAQIAIAADGSTVVVIEYDANPVEAKETPTHTVFKKVDSTLAPGVTQSIRYAYSADNKQMVYYIATADITRDDVIVQTSYFMQHEGGVMGMSKLTDQMAYAKEKYTNREDPLYISDYYAPVAGVNASFYNMSTGQPSGLTYIDGVYFGNASYDNFFAILKDGTAVIDYRSNEKKYTGDKAIWQAVGGSQWLVRDGQDVTATISGSYNTDRHSRTCVGVTADGKVVLMSLDGRQEPFSCGGSMHELAQIMLEAGCVTAINLDGGGSTTFASRPEGKDEVVVVNRPSDGGERAISSGLIIASLTEPNNVFDHATLTAEHDYVTPNSVVEVSAIGVSTTNNSAEIPAGAVWSLADAKYGTIEDGVFTSNGTVGDVVIQLVLGSQVVGSTTIHVVIPDITFDSASMTVPYNKSFALKVSGTTNNGMNKVVMKESDVIFELSDPSMGIIDGNMYTTCDADAGLTGGTITAKCVYDETKTATAEISFGKASVIVKDFEDQDITGWSGKTAYARAGKGHETYGRFENASVNLVNRSTGKVRNGDYALELVADFSTTTASGYKAVKYTFPAIDLTGATSFGMWMYLPVEDVHNLEFDIGGYYYMIEDDANVTEEGWYYIQAPVSKVGSPVSVFEIYMTDTDASYFNLFNKFSIYIDDLTIDYSNATEDREIPQFTSVQINTGLDQFAEMKGQTVSDNTITVKAVAAEDLSGNYTGLDTTSAKVYVDGRKINGFSCDDNGVITVGNITLANGTHTFRFEINDNNGNTGFVTRQIVINSENGSVYVARRDSGVVQPLAGSIVYFDVIARDAANVNSVSMVIDLDTLNQWELQGAETAYGYTINSSVDHVSNSATINLTRTKTAEVTGEAVIASLPVRVWQTTSYLNPVYVNAGLVSNSTSSNESVVISTPYVMWQTDRTRLVQIELEVLSGSVNGGAATFASKQMDIITELNRYRTEGYYTNEGKYVKGSVEFCMQGKDCTHLHTAAELEDKAATCTEAGYTGRTFCEVCDSVVVWGTKAAATGHTYETVDGVRKCINADCGKLFNGTFEGVDYVDGIALSGWVGDSYYVDGEKLTGIQKIEDIYYDFGEDGICAGKTKYTGIIHDGDVYRYVQLGVISSGWKSIDDEWYYFRQSTMAAATGHYHFDGDVWYDFEENGKLKSGVWVTDEVGTRYFYGPSYYRTSGVATVTFVEIDGKTYGFDKQGYIYTGLNLLYGSNERFFTLYHFEDNGVLIGKATTVYQDHYYENGVQQNAYKLVECDGYYYFVSDGNKVAKDCTLYLGEKFVTGSPFAADYYSFDADGKMIVRNGPDGDYFYKDNVRQKAYQLVEYEGDYYFINDGNKLAKNGTLYLGEKFVTGSPFAAGYYSFDATGKMIIKNGPDGDYFYKDNVRQKAYQLVEYEGDYYFINDGNKLAKNGTLYLGEKFVTGSPFVADYYSFDATGKMIIKNGPDGDYFYKNNVRQKAYQLVEYEGDYYFINDSNKLAKNGVLYLSERFVAGTQFAPGLYSFDADGKMIVN